DDPGREGPGAPRLRAGDGLPGGPAGIAGSGGVGRGPAARHPTDLRHRTHQAPAQRLAGEHPGAAARGRGGAPGDRGPKRRLRGRSAGVPAEAEAGVSGGMTHARDTVIGVLGAGTMGSGIAQVAAAAGHAVVLADTRQEALDRARKELVKSLVREVEKQRFTAQAAADIESRVYFSAASEGIAALPGCGLVIEAIVEDLAIKRESFRRIEPVVGDAALLATNTSSLSVTAIAAACTHPERVLGIHFFNPAPVMPLV